MKNKLTSFVTLMIVSSWLVSSLPNNSAYEKEINDWHTKRIKSLQKNTSWLSLAGLFWLEEGQNKFGSDPANEIVFPDNSKPFMGTISLKDTLVTISVFDDIPIMSDTLIVKEMTLRNDNQKNPTLLTYGSLQWYIIKRSNKYAVRLKDTEHPSLKSFKGIERFPVDINWRIKARLEKYDSPKTLKIPNVLGQVNDSPCPGALVFEVKGKEYRLDPIGEENSKRYWIIFGDATNGEETYGAGRFLYIDAVDQEGQTYIDFNKSYNPPCVFSPFATCPLPPAQNKLDVKILAGEKNWENEYN